MPPLPPNKNQILLIDLFISYAQAHLSTVSGVITTLSQYPPPSTPAPGVILWTGYFVPPSTPGGGPALEGPASLTQEEKTALSELDERNDSELAEEIATEEDEYVDPEVEDDVRVVNEEFERINLNESKRGILGSANRASLTNTKGLTKNLNKGWEGKEQAFQRTIVNPAEWGPKLKEKYGDSTARCMLACMKIEQNFKGFNNNIGGYDITAGGWGFDPTYHNGFVYAIEGTSGLKKAFVSFKSLDSFFEKTSSKFKQRGAESIKTAEQFEAFYYNKWFGGDGATKVIFDTYPGFSVKNGGKYKTLEEYRAACKATFRAAFKFVYGFAK